MASDALIPETRVLAIASHVVHGYVGNKMATCVLQAMGCDVSAINTVHYSNHTAYKQVKGTKTTAAELEQLYEGLRQSHLTNFDVLLTGYVPSADALRAVGKIGRDLKFNAATKPGSFFWVLDPVMGDNGQLYIPPDEVPEYKALLRDADLILPNQFEAETLAGTPITDLASLARAIHILHATYRVPHIIITSLRLTPSGTIPTTPEATETLTIVGSTATSSHEPRLFRISTPALPYFFSGTGDMFAALTVARLRAAVAQAPAAHDLQRTPSWRSPDEVGATELPLAQAAQWVCASMGAVLGRVADGVGGKMAAFDERVGKGGGGGAREEERHWRLMDACEVVVPRYVRELVEPRGVEGFKAVAVVVEEAEGSGQGEGEA
ncbi:Ribokinase-like protein [Boeremia exigua]|uniref:Ribokinase-like protein n=1 Tax=Boeremia exigua TaxID=749465 RepID=UPI001E8CDE20|nr:Ribokinase-like protein [Boeremia exigua]KAH6638463.1 Ribokinase-like protein [Boeremia exigua]